ATGQLGADQGHHQRYLSQGTDRRVGQRRIGWYDDVPSNMERSGGKQHEPHSSRHCVADDWIYRPKGLPTSGKATGEAKRTAGTYVRAESPEPDQRHTTG